MLRRGVSEKAGERVEGCASLGCPVFACTPDQFPSMMAAALTGKDLHAWASEQDVTLIRDLECPHRELLSEFFTLKRSWK